MAEPRNSQRIVGGSLTTIDRYPEMASLITAWPSWFAHECGGTILNNRAVLSAVQCFGNDPPSDWRIRVGSTFANSGGTVIFTSQMIRHPAFTRATFDNDIAVLRTASAISFSDLVRPGSIASPTYNLGDNQVVWAIGWGRDNFVGSMSEQLRHVQIWTVNQDICRSRYASIRTVTDNMLCSGWPDVGGRDQCQGDSGGPLFHNGVVVGVCSWGYQCALARYPGVNTRVSQYTDWIVSNA
uniref:trypsin n=1 Tax=Chilo suppressalis TaxID=168631 RepID=G9F9K6_CHISP|nr:seminal fluid protein CSSFP054 [Chilo suppressalis]AFK64829.1 trypsin-like proteinase [Chilo suppressalis]